MKLIKSVLLMTMVIGTFANAAITYGSNNAGAFYAGMKVGQAKTDIADASRALNIGLYGGYHLDSNFGAEVEYVLSQDKKYRTSTQGRVYDVRSLGAYGTYRYHFGSLPLYAKGKLGIANTNVDDRSADGAFVKTADNVGFAGGVAVGYNLGENLGLEAGYNYLGADTTSMMVGAHLLF